MRVLFFILLLFLFADRAGYAQWQQIPNPQGYDGTVGETVGNMVTVGSRIIAPADSGTFYITDDGAATWHLRGAVPGHPYAMSILTSDGTNIYASFFDSTLYRSTDGCDTWTKLNTTSMTPDWLVALTAAPGVLFASQYYPPNVYRSTDNGDTWLRIDSLQHFSYYNYLLNGIDQVIRVGTRLIAQCQGTMVFSEDNGITWDTISEIHSTSGYSELSSIGDTVLALNGESTSLQSLMAHSTDAGKTWSEDTTPLIAPGSIITKGGAFYVEENANIGIFKSTDGGHKWVYWSRGLPDLNIRTIATDGQTLVAAGLGFWRLAEDTGLWQWSSNGTPSHTVYCFDTTPNAICSGTNYWDFISWDEGTTWRAIEHGYPASSFIVQGDTLGMLCADIPHGAINPHNWVILPSSPADTSQGQWNYLTGGGWTTYEVIVTPIPNYCAANSEIFQVELGTVLLFPYGISELGHFSWPWPLDTSGLPKGGAINFQGLASLPTGTIETIGWNGQYLFAATRFDGMYRADDSDLHWSKMSNGFPDLSFAEDTPFIAFHSTLDYQVLDSGNVDGYRPGAIACQGQTVFVASPSGVFRSANNGANWSNTSQGLPARPIRNIKACSFGLVASADSGDIYFSPDNGDTWYDRSNGLAPSTVFAFQEFRGYLYISNANGIFRRPIPEVTDGVQQNIQTSTSLDLDVASPVNGMATVRFDTPVATVLDLSLYDLLGREVTTLCSGHYTQGTHSVTLDASRLAHGNYIAVLRAEGQSISRIIQAGQ